MKAEAIYPLPVPVEGVPAHSKTYCYCNEHGDQRHAGGYIRKGSLVTNREHEVITLSSYKSAILSYKGGAHTVVSPRLPLRLPYVGSYVVYCPSCTFLYAWANADTLPVYCSTDDVSHTATLLISYCASHDTGRHKVSPREVNDALTSMFGWYAVEYAVQHPKAYHRMRRTVPPREVLSRLGVEDQPCYILRSIETPDDGLCLTPSPVACPYSA